MKFISVSWIILCMYGGILLLACMSLPGRRHGSWNNGPDGHVRLIFRMTVHRIHLVLYQKQQQLELSEAHCSGLAARVPGTTARSIGPAIRNIHHSTNHALPSLSSSYAGRTPCWVCSLRPSASVVSALSISGSCHTLIYCTCMFAEALLPADKLLPERRGEGRYGREVYRYE